MTSSGFLRCKGFTYSNGDTNQSPYFRRLLGTYSCGGGGRIKIECNYTGDGGTNMYSTLTICALINYSELKCYRYTTGKQGSSDGISVVFYPAATNPNSDAIITYNVYIFMPYSSPFFNYFATISNGSTWTDKMTEVPASEVFNTQYLDKNADNYYNGYVSPDTGTQFTVSNYRNTAIINCLEIYNVTYSGLMTTIGGFNVSSSLIYKKNIQSLPDNYNLEMLMKYKPITYELISSDDDKQYPGFIAEDIQDISANLFINFNNGKPDSLDYSRINVHLVKCLQDLNIIVQQNKKEIDELKSIIRNL